MIADPPSTACGAPQAQSEAEIQGQRILVAAGALLCQGEQLLGSLPPEIYARRIPAVLNGSIGSHYRHCLDHFTSLLVGPGPGLIDFDCRARDPRIETDPSFAIRSTREIRAVLADWSTSVLSIRVETRCEVSENPGTAPVTGSTLGRELVYAIIHGVHHYALISVIAGLQGIPVPAGFALAPSTSAYLRTTGTAPPLQPR